jgi:histidine triad (HIT) family protein
MSTTHQKEENCIFCKIIDGTIPAYKVYEDDETLAFLDIHPNNPGHTLVIPKDHFENIYGTPSETLCRMIMTVQKMAIAVKNGADADGVNIMMNNESAAGQEVPHAHIHVIPRFNEDGYKHWGHTTYKEGEIEKTQEKIKTQLD